MEVSGQLHAPASLPPRERATGTHWIGGWLDPRAGLDMVSERKIPSPHLCKSIQDTTSFSVHSSFVLNYSNILSTFSCLVIRMRIKVVI